MTTTHARPANPVHHTSEDCHDCGEEILLAVEYEQDEGTILIHATGEPATCPHCGVSTDGPHGRQWMRDLQTEIRMALRERDAVARETAIARRSAPWD